MTMDTPEGTTKESQLEYLRRKIKEQLDGFKKRQEWYRRRYYRMRAGGILVSASITVVAGLKLAGIPHLPSTTTMRDILDNVVLVLGAVSTVQAAYAGFFNPHDSWHLNASTYNHLRALQTELEMEERGTDFRDREDEIVGQLFQKYQSILAENNQQWNDLRQKEK